MRELPAFFLDELDLSALEEIQQFAKDVKPTNKFANYHTRLLKAWKQAIWLKLDEAPTTEILDIGMGAGYFLYVCQRLGHRGIGIDRPGFPVWEKVRKWLGVECINHTVKPFEPLPDAGRFDLVTSFYAPFNYLHREKRAWTLDEWTFFLDNLRDDVLRPGGRVALEIKGGQIGDPDFVEFCLERGAVLQKKLLLFDPLR